MNFALIGAHPDGLAMARALAESGHRFFAFAGPRAAWESLGPPGNRPRAFDELESLLAQPEIEWVIVADELEHRPAVLRRALQSERHVLCVHPADVSLDAVYESVLIQKDTRKVLLPMLADRLMPGLLRLRQLFHEGAFGRLQVIECERRLLDSLGESSWDRSPLASVWEPLRALGGEIQEVSALASTPGAVGEELPALRPGDPVNLTGRFERGGLFRVLVLPKGGGRTSRLLLRGEAGQAELTFPDDLSGPSVLRIQIGESSQLEEWPEWKPWPALVGVVNGCLASPVGWKAAPLSWQDEIRCLELFDAARRSARLGRVVPMHYAEITEESTFKGVMTAAGCGLLWLVLLLMIVGNWAPWLWYAIIPLLIVFLFLQALRWVVPAEKP